MKPDIRPARLDDVPALVELGAKFIKASPYAEYAEINGAELADTLADLIESEHAVVLVATVTQSLDAAPVVTGGLVAMLAPMWFAPSVLMAVELAWFVDPKHRGTAGLMLARKFEHWALEQDVDLIAFSELRGAKGNVWPVGDALEKSG